MNRSVPPIDHLKKRLISPLKITHFLLDPHHPKGKFREKFLTRFGFLRSCPEVLSLALMNHAITGDLISTTIDERGCLYEITGPLDTPDGRNPRFTTIWIFRTGEIAELVTGYPA